MYICWIWRLVTNSWYLDIIKIKYWIYVIHVYYLVYSLDLIYMYVLITMITSYQIRNQQRPKSKSIQNWYDQTVKSSNKRETLIIIIDINHNQTISLNTISTKFSACIIMLQSLYYYIFSISLIFLTIWKIHTTQFPAVWSMI